MLKWLLDSSFETIVQKFVAGMIGPVVIYIFFLAMLNFIPSNIRFNPNVDLIGAIPMLVLVLSITYALALNFTERTSQYLGQEYRLSSFFLNLIELALIIVFIIVLASFFFSVTAVWSGIIG